MSSKIQKWGNSMGVRIPKAVLDKLNLKENSEVSIEAKDGVILISSTKLEYSLDNLVAGISKNNLHQETNIEAEGREVW